MQNKLHVKEAGLAASVLCIITLTACRAQEPQQAPNDNVTDAKESRPSLPVVEPPLSRSRLLLAVARAASSYSEGADDLQAQRLLDGKRIEVRLRFGCDGQGPNRGDHGWSIDPDGRTLRLRAVPTLSLDDHLVRRVADERVEAADGFWLTRPWLLRAACPAGRSASETAVEPTVRPDSGRGEQAVAPSVPLQSAIQRVAIAQFYTADDSRTRRLMDRPLEAVRQLKEGESAGQQGFNLVLSGRLRALENGRVILCAGTGRERPPDCLVSADVDRVWIERPDDNAVMAEWRA